MGEERDSFWQLERANRRKTVELVVIFILVYCFVGLALDLTFRTFRLVNYQLIGLPVLTIAAAVFALAQALRAYYRGSSLLMGAVGARDLAAESAKTQMVADVVDEMALAARIPPPRLCIMEDPAPNAFATGRDPAHSVICVTRGLLDQFDREELQGVIAHEMAYIRGHDTRITQMAAVMVGGFALLSGSILRAAAAQQREKATVPGFGLIALPVFIISGIGWLFAKTAAIALSREREYLADASAVEFTRNAAALIRALEHIARVESPLRASLRAVAPLFIVDPFECGGTNWTEYLDEVARIESQQDKSKEQRDAEVAQYMAKGMPHGLFQGAFSSHPPIHDRILRLRGLLHQPSDPPPESEAEVQARSRGEDGAGDNQDQSGGDGGGDWSDGGSEPGAADDARAGREPAARRSGDAGWAATGEDLRRSVPAGRIPEALRVQSRTHERPGSINGARARVRIAPAGAAARRSGQDRRSGKDRSGSATGSADVRNGGCE